MQFIKCIMQQAGSPTYQVCSHCVLDTSISNISFDEKGVCNFCNQYAESTPQAALSPEEMQSGFEAWVEKIRESGKGKPYDCIIGLSGGVDSSYVALLVKEAGLRPLAVHFDNGWNSEIAVSNIEHICKKLEIELYTYVVDWEEFRDLQLSFLKAGVANAEAPTDHGIFACLYRLAVKFGVRYIIDGVNQATEYFRPGMISAGWAYADLRHLKALHRKFGSVPLKTFPAMSLYKKAWLQKVKGIEQVSLLNYVPYVKSQAIEVLKEKVGWRSYGGKHHESLFTKWHQVVYLPTRFGFDKRRIHLSDLILHKQITREKALDELNHPQISPEERRQLDIYVQKKLGFTPDEYEALLHSPARSYAEYPNDAFIIGLYQRLKKPKSSVA